jgi:hypothetical protein
MHFPNLTEKDQCEMKGKTRVPAFLIMAAFLLVGMALPVAAGPGLGNSPIIAHPMSNGLNVGVMEPGEVVWYAVEEDDFGQPLASVVLNMVYKPGDHDVSPYVNFQVFANDQVDRWLQGYADSYTGMGVYTTTDFDDETAERLWSGSLPQDTASYIRLFNNSSQTVEYHLMLLVQESAAQPSKVEAMPQVVETAEVADSPRMVQPVALPTQSETSAAPLAAAAPAALNTQPVSAPMASLQWQMVALAIQNMPAADAAAWLQMASQMGWLPPLGGVAAQPASYMAPRVPTTGYGYYEPATSNALPLAIPQGGGLAAPEPAPVEAAPSLLDLYPNVYPVSPMVLHDGANVSKLAPGGEHWFTFMREDLDEKRFEHMAITMFVTPTDGNTSHNVNFQLFTGSQLHIWERGTPESMVPFGEGQWVSRDKDPITGERLWAGDLVDGDTYYMRVFNDTDHVVDYYVITNDIINTELGEKVYAANPGIWNPLVNPPLPFR